MSPNSSFWHFRPRKWQILLMNCPISCFVCLKMSVKHDSFSKVLSIWKYFMKPRKLFLLLPADFSRSLRKWIKIIYQIWWYSACAFLFLIVLLAAWFSRKNMIRSRILSSARPGLYGHICSFDELSAELSYRAPWRPSRRVSFERSKRIKRDGTLRRPNMSYLTLPSNRNSRGMNLRKSFENYLKYFHFRKKPRFCDNHQQAIWKNVLCCCNAKKK